MKKKEGYDNYSQLSKAGSSAFTLSAVYSVIIIKTFIQYTVKKKKTQTDHHFHVLQKKNKVREIQKYLAKIAWSQVLTSVT